MTTEEDGQIDGEEMENRQGEGSITALIRKNTARYAMILVLGIVLGILLLSLAYMVPVNTENRDVSYAVLEEEGWYPRTSTVSSADDYFLSFYPDVLDNSSDKIMLTIAMDTSEGRPLVRAMESFSDYAGSYSYYWHGYVAILRPLLFFFDFSEIRILNSACQILIILLLGWLIGREKGKGYVLALATSYILMNPRTVSMGLQYSWTFHIAYGGTLVLLSKRGFFEQKQRIFCFFLIEGMLTSYLDLLTCPLLTWGIPLLWWIITQRQERGASEWIKTVVQSGCVWIAGYAGMWAAKWAAATIILRRNVIGTAIEEVFLRSGAAKTGTDNLTARWNAVYVNWRHYTYKVYFVVLAGWLLWWIFRSLQKKWNKSSKRYAFFLIGISSLVWYAVLSNHTVIHHLFTYRIFGVSILAFMALALESVGETGENLKLSGGGRAAMAGLFGAFAVLAYICSLWAKEGPSVTNCGEDYQVMQMVKQVEMEVTFPCDTIIAEMDLGLQSESEQGQYEVELWEDDKLKARNTLYLKDCNSGNLQRFSPWWNLKSGRAYRITVESVGTDAPVQVWVEEAKDMFLPGFETVSVDGVEKEGQMMMGIRYMDRYHVPDEVRLFITLSWIGIFMSAACTLYGTKVLWNRKRM